MKNKKRNREEIYDVAVIGGGPAGMISAIRAAELGAKAVLIEKNNFLGRKLLLTGKGRCNITQAEFDLKKFAREFGREGDFLLSSLSVFGVKQTIGFFENNGLKTKIERGKRVFPQTDNAKDVLNVLLNLLKKFGVSVILNSKVEEIEMHDRRISRIVLKGGGEIIAKNYILAVGGKSYPGTGATGEGFLWSEQLGHTVTKTMPALVPLELKESWPKECQGLALKNVEITAFQDKKKKDKRFGEALFTHFGISGPIILDMSKKIGELLEKGEVKLILDLKPALERSELDKRVQRDFSKCSNKLFRNSLSELLPQMLIPVFIKLSNISPEKQVNKITKEERGRLVDMLKSMELTVLNTLGFDEAIITSGGVSLKEIDSKTMKSKLIDNLFLAGEIINLDGPTGGYNLQLCWSTGYIAGQSAASNK
jgi:predicted Rossmann fold flavoprotein